METLKPLARANLSERVAIEIMQKILTSHWKEGQKLPSEAELCKAFQIGRSTLREALKSLAFVGVVQGRHGEGTYVVGGPTKFVNRMLAHGLLNADNDIDNIYEARIALETELAALCAERRTTDDLQNLERLIKEMRGPLPGGNEQFLNLDITFHLSIAAGAKNPILNQLLETIRNLLREFITGSLQIPRSREVACKEHTAIVRAIRQRNPRKASTAMRHHLQTFQKAYKICLEAASANKKPEEYSLTEPKRG